MTSRVVRLVIVAVAAVGLLSACNLREGDASEYGGEVGGSPAPAIDKFLDRDLSGADLSDNR